ncbi:hypothetical protein PLICRDRAFT_562359 [Plicaturopsis crispa FD-325 SS-3]|nr:hypothetical protein PLICRDRAFT_562359 [Plicaturopsis crispa FD-325 SS-3]
MAAIPDHFPFQDLPNELVLSVFDFAAASSRQTCLTLTLVASWTRTLALPHLFSTVVFTSHTASRRFLRALDHDGERALLVRNLCDVSGDISGLHVQILNQVLTRCVNLTNIAVTAGVFLRVTLQCRFMEYINSSLSSSLPTLPAELTIVTPDDAEDRDFHAFYDFQKWMSTALYRGSAAPLPRMLDWVTQLDVSRAYEPTISRSVRLFRCLTHLKVLFEYSDETSPDPRRSFKACLSPTLIQLVLAPKDESILADVEFTSWFGEVRREDSRLCISRMRATAVGWEDITRRQASIWDMAICDTQEWESAAPS